MSEDPKERMRLGEGSCLLQPPGRTQLQPHKISQHIPKLCFGHPNGNIASQMTGQPARPPAECNKALAAPVHGQQSRQGNHQPQLLMHLRRGAPGQPHMITPQSSRTKQACQPPVERTTHRHSNLTLPEMMPAIRGQMPTSTRLPHSHASRSG